MSASGIYSTVGDPRIHLNTLFSDQPVRYPWNSISVPLGVANTLGMRWYTLNTSDPLSMKQATKPMQLTLNYWDFWQHQTRWFPLCPWENPHIAGLSHLWPPILNRDTFCFPLHCRMWFPAHTFLCTLIERDSHIKCSLGVAVHWVSEEKRLLDLEI
jgi:hypothetical protein